MGMCSSIRESPTIILDVTPSSSGFEKLLSESFSLFLYFDPTGFPHHLALNDSGICAIKEKAQRLLGLLERTLIS